MRLKAAPSLKGSYLPQGSAKGGMLADPFPAARASLLGWAATVGRGTQRASPLPALLMLQVAHAAHYVSHC